MQAKSSVSTGGVQSPIARDRREREYGSFYRGVPLPTGIKLEDVKATFADGVLEVSVPLPARLETKGRRVQIEAAKSGAKSSA